MILVVEDNPDIAELFRMALEGAGYDVAVADSGAAALASLGQHRVDLVLMDLALPGLGGVEAAIRAHAAGCRAPIIAVSGAMALIDSSRIAEAGFLMVVAKPVRLSALLDLVRDTIPATEIPDRSAPSGGQ